MIIDSLTLYNKFTPLDKIPGMIHEAYGLSLSPQTIANWLKEFAQYTPFLRMRGVGDS